MNNNKNSNDIVTIQIGNYANFIGSHYWNIQNENYEYNVRKDEDFEINPETLFRPISNPHKPDQIQYKPRVLVFDFKSNFGSINKEGKVNRNRNNNNINTTNNNNNNNNVDTYISSPLGNPIEPLDKTVDNSNSNFEYWSDYLTVDLPKNSIVEIPDSFNSIPTESQLTFDDGIQLLEHSHEIDDLYQDYLRKMIEECDNLSGFQILSDLSDLWGGVTQKVLTHVKDEYSSRPIVTISSHNPYMGNNSNSDLTTYNSTFGLTDLRVNSSIYLPLYVPNNILSKFENKSNKFQTSATLAASIDTCTLGYRSNFNVSMGEYCYQLASQESKNLLSLASSFGCKFDQFGFGMDPRTHEPKFPTQTLSLHPMMSSYTPNFKWDSIHGSYSENVSVRGDLYSNNDSSDYQRVYSMLSSYLGKERVINRKIYNISQPLEIFKNQFPTFLINSQKTKNTSTTILTQVSNSPSAHPYLSQLTIDFSNIVNGKTINRISNYSSDNIQEAVESISQLRDSYNEH